VCRHAFASNVADAGGSLDELQALLGSVAGFDDDGIRLCITRRQVHNLPEHGL
jgi:hypothetical protein